MVRWAQLKVLRLMAPYLSRKVVDMDGKVLSMVVTSQPEVTQHVQRSRLFLWVILGNLFITQKLVQNTLYNLWYYF